MGPSHLTLFARLILYSRTPSSPQLALSLFKISSELGDEYATFTLVDEALKHGRIQDLQNPKLQEPLEHLKKSAEAKNLTAMVLLARVLELKGEFKSASTVFRAAVATNLPASDNSDTPDKDALSEAWKGIARIEKRNGDLPKELQAWEAAATQCDDPRAFYESGLRKAGEAPLESLEYMLKAASSGVGDAAFWLGMAYSSVMEAGTVEETSHAPISRTSPSRDTLGYYRIIKEWFSIAAASDDCSSRAHARLQAARIMRKMGDPAQSLASLKEALHYLQLAPSNNRLLLTSWTDPAFDPTCADLSNMIGDKS